MIYHEWEIKMRQYVIFIKQRKFDTTNIMCFTVGIEIDRSEQKVMCIF